MEQAWMRFLVDATYETLNFTMTGIEIDECIFKYLSPPWVHEQVKKTKLWLFSIWLDRILIDKQRNRPEKKFSVTDDGEGEALL